MQDTIVVGAGLAGLTTATYLARAGHHVTLAEKSKDPGGRAITDTKDGFALNRGIHHGARVRNVHALTHAVRAALPAGIHEPALSVVLAQAAAEHLRINLRP